MYLNSPICSANNVGFILYVKETGGPGSVICQIPVHRMYHCISLRRYLRSWWQDAFDLLMRIWMDHSQCRATWGQQWNSVISSSLLLLAILLRLYTSDFIICSLVCYVVSICQWLVVCNELIFIQRFRSKIIESTIDIRFKQQNSENIMLSIVNYGLNVYSGFT